MISAVRLALQQWICILINDQDQWRYAKSWRI